MSTSIKEKIIKKLGVIVGEEFRYVFRAGNMLTLGFGNDIDYERKNIAKEIVARYALHIQTSWRMISGDRIILGVDDFYISQNGVTYQEFEENCGYGKSMFDLNSARVNEYLSKMRINVLRIEGNDHGDLTIYFENGYLLEVFVSNSSYDESWRFFEIGKEQAHFIRFDECRNLVE